MALEHGAMDVGHGGAEDVAEAVGLLDVLDDRHECRSVGRERRDPGVDEPVGDLVGEQVRTAGESRAIVARSANSSDSNKLRSVHHASTATKSATDARTASTTLTTRRTTTVISLSRCPPGMPVGETTAGQGRWRELAEVDGNRTRRTGIARPNRFEGGGAHQVPGHLPGDRRSSTTRARRRRRRRRAASQVGHHGRVSIGVPHAGGPGGRRGPPARRPTRRAWRWRRRGGGRGR